MAVDITGLNNKVENGGDAPRGVLTPKDWNTLVDAVIENQNQVTKSIKGIKLNDVVYDKQDSNGYITIELREGDYIVNIHVINEPPKIIAKGEPCKVKFVIDNKRKGETQTPHIFPATANFYWGTEKIGTITGIYDKDYNDDTNPNALKEVEFDFAKAAQLSTSADGNRLTIEVNNGEGGEGSKASISYLTRVVNASLSTTLTGGVNNKYIFTQDNLPKLTVVMNGEDGLLYIDIDGTLVKDGELINKSVTYEYTDIFSGFYSHGIHKMTVYATPKNYKDIKVTSPIYEYIYGDINNDIPLIITNITENQEFEVYNDLTINYTAYCSNLSDESVNSIILYIEDREGSKVFNDIVIDDIKYIKGVAEGTYKISLFPENGKDVDSITGDLNLVIQLGSTINKTPIKIVKTSDIELNALGGWDVFLTSRDNAASNDTKSWKCTNNKGDTYEVTFDDDIEFIPNGSGFNDDPDKYKAMRLKKGKHFTLNYQPFKDNPTWSGSIDNQTIGSGKTLSFEFAVRNCLNLNTSVISCVDENGIGFDITANQIKLMSNTKSLICDFKEDERIRVDITIDGKLSHYKYNTVKGTGGKIYEGESDEALMIIYINGVYQKLALIPQGTSFKQTNPKYITFGSDECDLDVYNIRIYNSTIYMDNIVKNYAADTPDTKEAISLMIRNDIFDDSQSNTPNIDLGKLIEKARPDLPIIYFTMDPSYNDILPKDKENWLNLTKTRYYNPHSKDTTVDGNSSWETKYGLFRNQGTSSMNYPWPWRNWDIKLDKYKDESGQKHDGYFEIPELGGATTEKWLQYDGMPSGIAKITLKKDYASSEMCNNAICSELFTDMANGIGDKAEYTNVLSPSQRDNGGAASSYRLTFKATPCFAIQVLNDGNNTNNAMGMMNLIPNKNEVKYLGMDTKSYSWDINRTQAWEISENHVNWDTPYFTTFAENDIRTPEQGGPQTIDGKIGYYGLVEEKAKDENGDYILDDDGNFTYITVQKYLGNVSNGIAGNYEARYPKDSTNWDDVDFGFASKDELNEEEFNKLFNEQYDILELHNWLVKTNRYCATDKPLETLYSEDYFGLLGEYIVEPWNINEDGSPKYTTDTKEYRLEKFKNEADDYLIKEQWILYYIWREQFWMYDSGSKNLQVYTMGKRPNSPDGSPMQWGCMVRDADTALGINNLGVDMFPSHLEDTDCYSINADGTYVFHYGDAANILSAKELPEGKNPVLNGQFGSIWLNIRDVWKNEISQMYRDLSSAEAKTHFSADSAIKRFDDHQNNWSESLYNWGMRQYFGGDPFTAQISSGNGNKRFSRKNWLEKGFYYRNSKYDNLADYVSWRSRTYETDDVIDRKVLNIKTYIPMYIATGGSTSSMQSEGFKKFRITDLTEGYNVPTGSAGFDFKKDDTNTYLFGSNNITDLGDLARFIKLKSEGSNDSAIKLPSEMTKLTHLRLGHHVIKGKPGHDTPYTEKTEHGTRELRNELVTNLNINNLPSLTYLDVTNHVALSTLTFNRCTQLEEFYASGTDRLKTIQFPQTTTLKEVHLGSGLTQLNIKNLTGIKVFNWDKSYVSDAGTGENFDKSGMKKLEYLYIENCGDLLKGDTSYDILYESIDSLVDSYAKNIFDDGVCHLYDINWTNADEDVISKLADIIENGDVTGHIHLNKLTYNTKVKLMSKFGNIDDEKNKKNSLYITYPEKSIGGVTMPTKLFIYKLGDHQLTFIPNNMEGNNFVKYEWSLTGYAADYATINSQTGVLTLNKVGTEDEKPAATVAVKIYLSDGSTIDASTTVYFYERSAKLGDYVFNDGSYGDELESGKTAIGVCFYIDDIVPDYRLMIALKNAATSVQSWGLCKPTKSGSTNINGIDGYEDSYYDTPIVNITNPGDGIETSTSTHTNLTDSYIKDGEFVKFNSDTFFGDIRLIKVGVNDKLANPENYKAGDYIPVGLYKTQLLIAHRNMILNAENMDIPQSDDYIGSTEQDSLNSLLANNGFGQSSDNYNYLLYYPAASYCYAYEPDAKNLVDKFKKHNWWLPACGELARALYYLNIKEGDSAIFNKSITDGVFSNKNFTDQPSSNKMWTITEMSEYQACNIQPNGRVYNSNYTHVYKSVINNYVRAICRF